MARVIFHFAKKELIQALRDKRMLMIILVAPVLQVVLFGFAVNLDLADQNVVIADADNTPTSRDMTRAISHDDSFRIVGHVRSHKDGETAVANRDASLAVLVPKGFERDLETNRAEVLVVLDGADSNTALRAGGEVAQILNNRAIAKQKKKIGEVLGQRGVSKDAVLPELRIETRAWFNPEMKTAVFLVPGVFALVLFLVTTMLTAMGLTREKELGTLDQIMVTPARPAELMMGKSIPFVCIGLIDVALVVAVSVLVFDLPVRGSIGALFFTTGLYLFTTLGAGLFIATISANQQQAMMSTFFFMLPAFMLSGYFFPIENMPQPVQWLTYANPLRYYMQIARGILIKGSSLGDLWVQVSLLTGLGLLVLASAALRFQKRVS